MNPQPQSSGQDQPPLGSNRRLYGQLQQELASLLQRTEAEGQAERRAAAQLTERIGDKIRNDRTQIEETARHIYGVFAVGAAGRRRMVLRDIAELDGRKPMCTTGDFAEAIRIAGEVIEDPVRRPHPPVNIGELRHTLGRLVREIRQITEGNGHITGDGTTAAPYMRTDGEPLPVCGPFTVGFPGATPAQLDLRARGQHLIVAKKSSS